MAKIMQTVRVFDPQTEQFKVTQSIESLNTILLEDRLNNLCIVIRCESHEELTTMEEWNQNQWNSWLQSRGV